MKFTLITGASGGIGKAITNKLAERKHNLILVARNSDKLEKHCRVLSEEFGITAQFIVSDLAQPKAAEQVFEETHYRGWEVEMLINNAGIGSSGEFSEIKLESELALIHLNISSLVALTHLFLPQMQKNNNGTIVNIASMTAFMPIPYMSTYAASKTFVRYFTESITQEFAAYNIHIMLFFPGLTKTNFNSAAGLDSEKAKGLNSSYDSAPTQTPEEVATELMKALEKKRNFSISGRLNRIGAKVARLLPNKLIAKNIAKTYRKKMKM